MRNDRRLVDLDFTIALARYDAVWSFVRQGTAR
jgi:hypothetical protein